MVQELNTKDELTTNLTNNITVTVDTLKHDQIQPLIERLAEILNVDKNRITVTVDTFDCATQPLLGRLAELLNTDKSKIVVACLYKTKDVWM